MSAGDALVHSLCDRIEAILALHTANPITHHCQTCAVPSPCDTAQAAGVTA